MSMQGVTASAFVLSLLLASSAASSAELGCIGGYNLRQNGTELDTTHYRFRNFNSHRTLTVTAVTIYAFDGTPLFALSAGSFPATFNPVIGPHQTTGIELEDLFGNNQAPNNFVQTVIAWEGDRGRGDFEPLHVAAARITRARVKATGDQGETRARGFLACRNLKSEDRERGRRD
jgi:hypothetical protein